MWASPYFKTFYLNNNKKLSFRLLDLFSIVQIIIHVNTIILINQSKPMYHFFSIQKIHKFDLQPLLSNLLPLIFSSLKDINISHNASPSHTPASENLLIYILFAKTTPHLSPHDRHKNFVSRYLTVADFASQIYTPNHFLRGRLGKQLFLKSKLSNLVKLCLYQMCVSVFFLVLNMLMLASTVGTICVSGSV